MKIDDIRTYVEAPEKLLRDKWIRDTFFVDYMKDRIDDFEVCYSWCLNGGKREKALFFTNHISEKELRKWDRTFRDFAGAKYMDGKMQSKRYNEITARFGKAGEIAVIDMFKDTHEI